MTMEPAPRRPAPRRRYRSASTPTRSTTHTSQGAERQPARAFLNRRASPPPAPAPNAEAMAARRGPAGRRRGLVQRGHEAERDARPAQRAEGGKRPGVVGGPGGTGHDDRALAPPRGRARRAAARRGRGRRPAARGGVVPGIAGDDGAARPDAEGDEALGVGGVDRAHAVEPGVGGAEERARRPRAATTRRRGWRRRARSGRRGGRPGGRAPATRRSRRSRGGTGRAASRARPVSARGVERHEAREVGGERGGEPLRGGRAVGVDELPSAAARPPGAAEAPLRPAAPRPRKRRAATPAGAPGRGASQPSARGRPRRPCAPLPLARTCRGRAAARGRRGGRGPRRRGTTEGSWRAQCGGRPAELVNHARRQGARRQDAKRVLAAALGNG